MKKQTEEKASTNATEAIRAILNVTLNGERYTLGITESQPGSVTVSVTLPKVNALSIFKGMVSMFKGIGPDLIRRVQDESLRREAGKKARKS